MKKQILTLLTVGAASSMFAQLPVGTAPQNKKAILEEFTGIHCGYCPDGHYIANVIQASDPANTVLINIHSGSFANAAVGEPDLKTAIGTAIDLMPGNGITGYPAGTMNRSVLTGTAMAGGRGNWAAWATTVKTQTAYCNVAVQGNVDAVTRVLTYTAQVYYTSNSPVSTNSITVMLLENKILGIQDNYGTPTLYNASNYNADGTYNHNHVLRAGLTAGNFGITIPVTTSGTTFSTTGTYTIPATYGATGKENPCLLGNIELVAFVTETDRKTINGSYGPISITNIANARDASLSALIADAETCAGNLQPTKFRLVNNGSANITSATITYGIIGGTTPSYSFSGNLAPFTQTVITLPGYAFTAAATNTLSIVVTGVNGSTDQNPANNLLTKSIPLTTKISSGLNLKMDFTQDRYGSELTWEVRDEVSNTLIASGGPYADLAATGVLLHTVPFTVAPNKCYKVVVNDAYGDGFNSGYGAGKYQIIANPTVIYTMSGVMGDQDIKLFKTSSSATGINEQNSNITNISVYPSPAKNAASLSLELLQNESISINVVNAIGQVVYTDALTNLSAGNHVVNFNTENWASGVYSINVSSTNGTSNIKLVVSK
jgi:hypothetical protein